MRKRLLTLLLLTILVTSTLVGCDQASSTPSTLTILSITEGNVFVMKAGTDNWAEAEVGMSLEVGDSIETGDDCSAEITFFDGSTIELEAGTEIEITSLDISSDTGATTITLMQTLGTTISRVTKILDPASRYEVETPSGVAGVRGSILIVTVIEDGTTWITNQEGNIYAVAQGVELHIPEGQQCIIRPGQLPELIPIDGQPPTDGLPPEPIPSNHPPTDINLDNSSVAENQRYGTVVGNFSTTDPDIGDTFTYSLVSGDGDDNNTSFMIVGSQLQTVNSFDYETKNSYSTRVRSTDSGMLYYEKVFIINVTNVYDPPVNYQPMAVDDAAITDEDTPVIVDAPGVLDNDSDPDAGDTLSVTAVDTSGTVGNVTAWDSDGSFTYDPNGQFEYLQAGNSTTDSFTYTVSDGHGGTDTATVTITINGANDPPVAVDDNATTPQDTPVTINVLNNDYDIDGYALTVVSATNGTYGSVINNGSNVTYTPSLGFNGNDSFTYTLSDGNGGTDTATVSITVSGAIVTVAAGDYHTVGLSSNATVVAVGRNFSGQCNVGGWTDIIQVAGGAHHTVGLTSDGTVVAVGHNACGQCNVGGWTNITQVAAGYEHTVGLSSNSTAVAAGSNYYNQCDIGGWTDITQVAAGGWHTVGLSSNSTVVAVGWNYYHQCDIGGWTDIIQVATGHYHTVGLKSDGTVVAVGNNFYEQCELGDWMDIIQITAGEYYTVGLKSDGTVVAVGHNDSGQCDVGDWVDIIQVAAGWRHTVGLKSDGTVVAVGLNLDDQCNVAGWDLK